MSNAAVAEPPVATEEPVVADPKNRTREDQRTKQKRQPPYAVIVHNDEEHTFPYVIEMLMKICGHAPEKAYILTTQIHLAGKSVVWTGALEHAELKRDQIRGYGTDFYATKPVEFPLGVTIEPLPSE
jgi:ATP-dependent Clp protease adaptor protein ClpS